MARPTAGQLPTALHLEHRPGDDAWEVTFTYTGAAPSAPTAGLVDSSGAAVAGVTLDAAVAGQVVTLTLTGTPPVGRHAWFLEDQGLTHLAGDFTVTYQPRRAVSATSVAVEVATGATVTVETPSVVGGGGGGGSMTGAEILAALAPVDGAGSGLDADLLDGQHAAAFATSGHAHTGVYDPAGTAAAAVSAHAASSAAHATLPLSGTGEPNGVVTASPGRLYEDTATGYLWSKITGTGNTGWEITNAIRNETLDAGGAGGENYSTGLGVALTNATNGPRGDSIASDTALGAGASFGFGHYVNFTADKALAGPGAMHGVGVYGEIAADSRYGEGALMGGVITNNRDGALAEGYEVTIVDTTGGGRNVGVGIIAKMQAAVTRWFRGIWLSSQGTQAAGDAIYVDGPAGWSNVIVAKDTAGTVQFQVDAAGNVTGGFVTTYGVFRRLDPTRFFLWYDGSPEGVVAAAPGAAAFNTLGGSGSSIYVKTAGTGNTGWRGVPTSAADLPDLAEAIDDRVAALLVAGANVTLTYNDAANTLTVAASGGGGGGSFSFDNDQAWLAAQMWG